MRLFEVTGQTSEYADVCESMIFGFPFQELHFVVIIKKEEWLSIEVMIELHIRIIPFTERSAVDR